MGPLGVFAFLGGGFLVELTKNVRNVGELKIYSYICGEKNELRLLSLKAVVFLFYLNILGFTFGR